METPRRRASYDYRNRLVEVEVGSTTHQYRYDVFDRRVLERTLESGTVVSETTSVHDGWRVIEEQSAAGALVQHVNGDYPDQVLVTRRRIGSQWQAHFLHQDDLYSVVAITDSSGALVETYDYADYGEPTIRDAAGVVQGASLVGNRFMFAGKQRDQETGLYFSRLRYLDPATGRFLTRDPAGTWSDRFALGNGYTYAGNNPWSMVDPYGDNAIDLLRGIASGGTCQPG